MCHAMGTAVPSTLRIRDFKWCRPATASGDETRGAGATGSGAASAGTARAGTAGTEPAVLGLLRHCLVGTRGLVVDSGMRAAPEWLPSRG